MLIRALIVVLAILNAGVALWWWSRPAVVDLPVPAMSPPEGVPVLQLLSASELPPPSQPVAAEDVATPAPVTAAAVAGKPVVAATTPAPERTPAEVAVAPAVCVSLGVFADRGLLDAAVAQAGAVLAASRARAVPQVGTGSYRVMMPPAASREAAQAMVKRIVDAGISDYFIIAQGEQANAVALGQYRNRDGAQRRLDQLQAAGFAAVIVPSQPAQGGWWLDARLVAGASASQARNATAADKVQSLDCARMR